MIVDTSAILALTFEEGWAPQILNVLAVSPALTSETTLLMRSPQSAASPSYLSETISCTPICKPSCSYLAVGEKGWRFQRGNEPEPPDVR